MSAGTIKRVRLQERLEELQAQLEIAEETLRAIRYGEVDALVVGGAGEEEQIYTLRGAEQPYRVLIEAMQEGAVTMTTAGDVLYANRCFAAMTGRPLERVIGQSVLRLVHPDDAGRLQALLACDRPGHAELRMRTPTGDAPVQVTVSPLPLDGATRALCMVVTDLSELKRREQESLLLQEMALGVAQAEDVEAALRLVLSRICEHTGWPCGEAWVPSHDGRLHQRAIHAREPRTVPFLTDGERRAFGPGTGMAGIVWKRRRSAWITDLGAEANLIQMDLAARCGLAAGLGVPVLARDEPVGVISFWMTDTTAVDRATIDMITASVAQLGAVIQRKQAEERTAASLHEKEALLQEIHHRVKNNLQVITSLLRMQSRAVKDPAVRRMFEDSEGRVRSMALVHESLYASPDLARIDFAVYCQRLVEQLRAAYGTSAHVLLEVAPFEFDVETAVPLGLIVNELVSNAFKHAFADRPDGLVRVAMHRDGDAMELVVRDDGVGIPPTCVDERPKSMGLQIVRILARHLEGQLSIARDEGTRFGLRFLPRRREA